MTLPLSVSVDTKKKIGWISILVSVATVLKPEMWDSIGVERETPMATTTTPNITAAASIMGAPIPTGVKIWAVDEGSWERAYYAHHRAIMAAEQQAARRHDGAAAHQLIREITPTEAIRLWVESALFFE